MCLAPPKAAPAAFLDEASGGLRRRGKATLAAARDAAVAVASAQSADAQTFDVNVADAPQPQQKQAAEEPAPSLFNDLLCLQTMWFQKQSGSTHEERLSSFYAPQAEACEFFVCFDGASTRAPSTSNGSGPLVHSSLSYPAPELMTRELWSIFSWSIYGLKRGNKLTRAKRAARAHVENKSSCASHSLLSPVVRPQDGFPPTNLNSLSLSLSLSLFLPSPPSPSSSTDDAFRSRFLWARKPMLAAAAARLSCGGSLPPPRSLVW